MQSSDRLLWGRCYTRHSGTYHCALRCSSLDIRNVAALGANGTSGRKRSLTASPGVIGPQSSGAGWGGACVKGNRPESSASSAPTHCRLARSGELCARSGRRRADITRHKRVRSA